MSSCFFAAVFFFLLSFIRLFSKLNKNSGGEINSAEHNYKGNLKLVQFHYAALTTCCAPLPKQSVLLQAETALHFLQWTLEVLPKLALKISMTLPTGHEKTMLPVFSQWITVFSGY